MCTTISLIQNNEPLIQYSHILCNSKLCLLQLQDTGTLRDVITDNPKNEAGKKKKTNIHNVLTLMMMKAATSSRTRALSFTANIVNLCEKSLSLHRLQFNGVYARSGQFDWTRLQIYIYIFGIAPNLHCACHDITDTLGRLNFPCHNSPNLSPGLQTAQWYCHVLINKAIFIKH